MKVLVTGAAGFIGAAVTKNLLAKGFDVVGIDNFNDYYDVRLKDHRLESIPKDKFTFHKIDIENKEDLADLFKRYQFSGVVNLAARAGVRYSIEKPELYFKTNVLGTLNLLENIKSNNIKNFVLASTSSLYAGKQMPFIETLKVDNPLSPYAASKQAAESLAYSYHHLYDINIKVLRYFTVYGPAGRPDMSVLRFIKFIDEGKEIKVFGDGTQSRDFTYIEDIAEGTVKALQSNLKFEVINLGGGDKKYELNYVIGLIEDGLGKKANRNDLPFHTADMMHTSANINKANDLLGWQPQTNLSQGIKETVQWYLDNKEFCSTLNFN